MEGREMMLATEQHLPNVISKKAGGFTLCHFSYAEDLLFGIEALRSFNIPIHEVYSPIPIDGLKSRLEIKRLKTGYAFLKYGCFGGISFTSLIGYALAHNWSALLLTILFTGVAFVFASWLIPTKPPKIVRSNDPRFLIVIETNNIIPDEGVASFLRYSGSVEITRAVKRMLVN
jgi:hypothetical protein